MEHCSGGIQGAELEMTSIDADSAKVTVSILTPRVTGEPSHW